MDYAAEATQLFVIVVVLVVAYFGVMFWTKRVNNRPQGEAGGGGGGGLGGFFSGGASVGGSSGMAGVSDEDIGTTSGKKKGADRNKGRFQLQGRDAEVAAKVLKRMLKQDPGFRGGKEGSK